MLRRGLLFRGTETREDEHGIIAWKGDAEYYIVPSFNIHSVVSKEKDSNQNVVASCAAIANQIYSSWPDVSVGQLTTIKLNDDYFEPTEADRFTEEVKTKEGQNVYLTIYEPST